MGCMCAHVTQHSKYIQKINSIFFKLRRSTGCQIGSAPSAATNSYQRIHCTLQGSNFIVHCSLRSTCIMLKTRCKAQLRMWQVRNQATCVYTFWQHKHLQVFVLPGRRCFEVVIVVLCCVSCYLCNIFGVSSDVHICVYINTNAESFSIMSCTCVVRSCTALCCIQFAVL